MTPFLIWYSTGMLGAILIWQDHIRLMADLHDEEVIWCPTPRAIIAAIFVSLFGTILLLSSLMIVITPFFERKKFEGNWFTRPICGGKKCSKTSGE